MEGKKCNDTDYTYNIDYPTQHTAPPKTKFLRNTVNHSKIVSFHSDKLQEFNQTNY